MNDTSKSFIETTRQGFLALRPYRRRIWIVAGIALMVAIGTRLYLVLVQGHEPVWSILIVQVVGMAVLILLGVYGQWMVRDEPDN